MEKLGGVFLVQDLQPRRVLGSLRARTMDHTHGWIDMAFFQEADVFLLEQEQERTQLVLARTVAVSLISLIHIQVEVNRHLRGETRARTTIDTDPEVIRVTTKDGNQALVASWASNDEGFEYKTTGAQMELHIREDRAWMFILELTRELARIAAQS